MLTRIVRFALCHRRLVVASWLVLLVAGAAAAASVAKRLTFDFALPGEPGYETAKRIERTYDNGGAQAPSVLVATVPRGETVRRSATAIGNGFQALTTAHPELRIVDYRATHDERFITRDGRRSPSCSRRARAASARPPNQRAQLPLCAGACLANTPSRPPGSRSSPTTAPSTAPASSPRRWFGALGALAVQRSSSLRCSRSCRC